MDTIKYENRLVAFIDILGFKSIIKESEKDTFKLTAIYEALNFLKNKEQPSTWTLKLIEIEECAQYKQVKNFDISDKTSCTCFSDSIVISVITEEDEINFLASTLIANIAYVGSKLMEDGILIRGGITYGSLLHTSNGVIMGPALIEAYELESTVAKYPRIVLSNKLISKMNYPISTKKNSYPYHQYIDRFEDGCVGFHQMIYFQVVQSWVEMTNSKLKSHLKKIKQTILNGLDMSFQHPEIYQKYIWLKKIFKDLVILEDGVKEDIRELNEGISGPNIHHSHTDLFYYR